jgi:hypothetical protein
MSVTTKITYIENDYLDIREAIQNGALTLSVDDDLVLLEFDTHDYGIDSIVNSNSDPVDGDEDGILHRNRLTGDLFFSKNGTYSKVGVILKREGVNVISRTQKNPPLNPLEGDQYIIPPGKTNWPGRSNYLARFCEGRWFYIVPTVGLRVGVRDEGIDYTFDGYSWEGDIDTMWGYRLNLDPLSSDRWYRGADCL